MVAMIFSVEPTSSASSTTSCRHSGCTITLTPGISRRAASTASTENRPCTEQCPRHRIIVASRSCSGVRPPHRAVRVPDHAVVERAAEVAHGGVAAEVLVGQEEHLAALAAAWSSAQVSAVFALRRGADRAAVPAGEGLDRRGGVHVGHRHGDVGDAGLDQLVPALLDLVDRGHVGHRAAGREVGQHHGLGVGGQDVGRLGHEVHAAEDDALGIRPGGGLLGQLEGVAGDVGELDDLVALVVVAEHERPGRRAPPWPRGPAPRGRGRRGRAGRRGTPRRARWPGRARGRARGAARGCVSRVRSMRGHVRTPSFAQVDPRTRRPATAAGRADRPGDGRRTDSLHRRATSSSPRTASAPDARPPSRRPSAMPQGWRAGRTARRGRAAAAVRRRPRASSTCSPGALGGRRRDHGQRPARPRGARRGAAGRARRPAHRLRRGGAGERAAPARRRRARPRPAPAPGGRRSCSTSPSSRARPRSSSGVGGSGHQRRRGRHAAPRSGAGPASVLAARRPGPRRGHRRRAARAGRRRRAGWPASSSWSPPTSTPRCSACRAPARSRRRRRAPRPSRPRRSRGPWATSPTSWAASLPCRPSTCSAGCRAGSTARPGAGAAGGLGYGLLAARRARRVGGVAEVLRRSAASAPPRRAATWSSPATGGFDWQPLRGTVVAGVAAATLETGRPTVRRRRASAWSAGARR